MKLLDSTKVLQISSTLLVCILFFLMGARAAELDAVEKGWLKDAEDLPDRVNESSILVFEDQLIIKGQYQLSKYTDTNSMLPILDKGSTGINQPVYADTPIYVGDLVSYRLSGQNRTTIHRIVGIEQDDKGIYYVLKGDNLPNPDPFKVRKEHIQRLTVGVLW
jgi:hypothetical protein